MIDFANRSNTIKVLGVKIDDVAKATALDRVKNWLVVDKKRPRIIATVGPEFLVTAQEDREFRAILNKADLCLPDGVGLRLAGVKNRVAGIDFMGELCREATRNGWTIGLLGGREGVARETKTKLEEWFPGLKVVFALDGEEADNIIRLSYSNNEIEVVGRGIKKRKVENCDLLFVALGHPKQEKFLHLLQTMNFELLTFRVGMGVGGAFDEISGRIPMCPGWIAALGLKWLFRVIVEPWPTKPVRIRRIIRATVVFPLALFRIRG